MKQVFYGMILKSIQTPLFCDFHLIKPFKLRLEKRDGIRRIEKSRSDMLHEFASAIIVFHELLPQGFFSGNGTCNNF